MLLLKSIIDKFLIMPLFIAACIMKLFRVVGPQNLNSSRNLLDRMGIFPIVDHYHDPYVASSKLSNLNAPRNLPGIDFRIEDQKRLLASFTDIQPLISLGRESRTGLRFSFDNPSFVAGDAEIWYHMIRHFKPGRIIEIGSGHSTRMARFAIERNRELDPSYACRHLCIEPFEAPWLEDLSVSVLRSKVEDVDIEVFKELDKNDFLFIDSSHVIRPQGDLIYEFLEIIPSLKQGVIVHVHDIFTPRDYLKEWLVVYRRLWNEQYLLEAYISDNPKTEVLLANNMMRHGQFDLFKAACPYLTEDLEPGSFYFRIK